MTLLQIDVQYGEYTIALSTLDDRTMCNVFMTAERNQILTNRVITATPVQRKGIDFYLAGIEIFAKEAIATILRDAGASNPH